MFTEPRTNGGTGRSTTGRKDKSKQDEVTKPQVILDRIKELQHLKLKAAQAGDAAREAVKKAAKDSGYNVKNVNAFINARIAGKDVLAEMKRDAEQQLELFEEVGEK